MMAQVWEAVSAFVYGVAGAYVGIGLVAAVSWIIWGRRH